MPSQYNCHLISILHKTNSIKHGMTVFVAANNKNTIINSSSSSSSNNNTNSNNNNNNHRHTNQFQCDLFALFEWIICREKWRFANIISIEANCGKCFQFLDKWEREKEYGGWTEWTSEWTSFAPPVIKQILVMNIFLMKIVLIFMTANCFAMQNDIISK